MIEFKDIDKKKGIIRVLELPINKLEKFLNSKAFHPKNCYQNKGEKVLKREN